MDDSVTLARGEGPFATLLLNRPARRNALTVAMWRAIPALVRAAEDDPTVLGLFVRGAGGAFAAGADIEEMPRVYATAEAALAANDAIQGAMSAVEACAKPVIALVQGACVGGGCGLALAADLRFAEAGARFAITPAKLGLVYGAADARRLVQAVGLSRAKDMLFTGRLLDAEEALRIGLVDRVVAPGGLDSLAADYAATLAGASQHSIRSQKRILGALADGDDAAQSRALFAASFSGADFAEGFAAFMGKRPPTFPVR